MSKIGVLIQNQKIYIDNHLRNVPNDFNDKKQEVHIHKEFREYPNQKNNDVYIKIPLNSKKKISISPKVSNRILKEIRDVLDNSETREKFINEVCKVLKEEWKWKSSIENKNDVAKKIANAFGLKKMLSYTEIIHNSELRDVVYFWKEEENTSSIFKMQMNRNGRFFIREVNVKKGKVINIILKKNELDNNRI